MLFFAVASLFALFFSLAGSQSIDPNSVPIGTRNTWCTNQEASCPLLCTQIGATNSPTSNTCDATSLAWSCVCSNGIQPNASAFSQTIPFYECQESATQCAGNCNGDNNCVSSCYSAHPCGAQSPPRINATSSTTMNTASATAGGSATASSFGADSTGFFGSSGTPSPSSSAGGNLLAPRIAGVAETCGFVILLSLLAGFAFAL